MVKEGEIQFTKTYLRADPSRMLSPIFELNFKEIKYIGRIFNPDDVITVGEYNILGYNKLMSGTWRMESISQ